MEHVRPSREQPGYLNIGCGPHRAPAPWWNTDVVRDDRSGTWPDEITKPLQNYGARSCHRIYMGHVLEHVPWVDVRAFLLFHMKQLVRNGELAIVGPDVLRMIQQWRDQQVPWDLVLSGLEDSTPQDDLGDWKQARHWWNCHEQRVVAVMASVGFANVEAVDIGALSGDWPVVGRDSWQMAVVGRRP